MERYEEFDDDYPDVKPPNFLKNLVLNEIKRIKENEFKNNK